MESRKQAYDIDIIELYFSTKEFIAKNKILDKEKYIEGFLDCIRLYFQNKNLDFDKDFKKHRILTIFSDDRLYPHFLARDLCIRDFPKINFFLDYHKSIFKTKKEFDFVDFPTLLEHHTYMMMNNWMSIDRTEERLDRIMQWVEKNKTISSETNIENKFIDSLEWLEDKRNLKNISKDLKIKGFTKKSTDFEKIFTEQRELHWLQEPEFLAYLLYQLYHHPKKQFSTFTKSKAYLQTAQLYFYNYCSKNVKKFNFSNLIINVRARQQSKHRKLRERVDLLISEFIK